MAWVLLEGEGLAGESAQCHLVFPKLQILQKYGGADPQVRAGRPRPAVRQRHQPLARCERPTGASAADRGVRPTNYADCPLLGKLSDIGRKRLPHLQYSRFLTMPGCGTGYVPSGPARRGAGPSRVSLSTSGANSCSQFIIWSKVTICPV